MEVVRESQVLNRLLQATPCLLFSTVAMIDPSTICNVASGVGSLILKLKKVNDQVSSTTILNVWVNLTFSILPLALR